MAGLWCGTVSGCFCRAATPQLTARATVEALELSWNSESVTPEEPFLHYEFQLQKSTDLVNWESAGEVVPGGVAATSTVLHMAELPREDVLAFYRLSCRWQVPGADLSGLDLTHTELRNADLSNANLTDVRFGRVNLDGAVLDGATLRGADLFTGVVGQPRIARLGGPPDGALDEYLPAIAYWPKAADYDTRFKGIDGLYVSHRVLMVLLNPGQTVAGLNGLLAQHGARLAGSLPAHESAPPLVVVWFPTATHEELEQVKLGLANHSAVQQAAWDTLISTAALPPQATDIDPWWSWEVNASPNDDYNWGWEESRVPQMWNLNDGINKREKRSPVLSSILTGVIDNFVNEAHPDLAGRVYRDFNPDRHPPSEDPALSHGTHVAGTIGAVFENGSMIAGVNPFAFLVLKDNEASLWSTAAERLAITEVKIDQSGLINSPIAGHLVYSQAQLNINAFQTLVIEPVRVVNMSVGIHLHDIWKLTGDGWIFDWDINQFLAIAGPVVEEQGKVFASLAQAHSGTLIVSAAGNDSDTIPGGTGGVAKMPAEYQSPMNWAAIKGGQANILVVENLDRAGGIHSSSAVGGHISGPGTEMGSIGYPPSAQILMTGTSQAAPFVTGLAGYLAALQPNLTITEIKDVIVGNAVADTGGAPRIDAFASALDIDRKKGGKNVLMMLLDFDDGTEDGNLRVEVKDSPTTDRSFLKVTGPDYTAFDADGDGGPGDSVIDMSDFRRWRDGLLIGDGRPHALDGSPAHVKKDGNGDGLVNPVDETSLFPRGDFNGDGIMDTNSVSQMTGALANEPPLTDLDVLIKSGLWADTNVNVAHLPHLIDSADIHASAKNFFTKNSALGISEATVSAYIDGPQPEKENRAGSRKFEPQKDGHIFTVPVGQTYFLRSEPIPLRDGTNVIMVSPGTKFIPPNDRGADYADDLVLWELTVNAKVEPVPGAAGLMNVAGNGGSATGPRAAASGIEKITSEPTEPEVDAHVPAEGGFTAEDQSSGARGWANERGTFYALARTGPLEISTPSANPETHEFSSSVAWQRSFVKDGSHSDPTFEVHPMQLRLIDGRRDFQDLEAFAEIRVEKRISGSASEWETVFYSMTEIAGYSEGPGGGHTFRIVDHKGDLPQQPLELDQGELFTHTDPVTGEVVTVPITIGAAYFQDKHDGSIPLDDVQDGETFEIRYTLNARAASWIFDEFAEAYIGDPLQYGTGMRMEYGDFGELIRMKDCSLDPDGRLRLRHRSLPDLYFILWKTGPGEPSRVPVALSFGGDGDRELVDPQPGPDASCDKYQLDYFPLDQPRDTDQDGIDDVYELLRPHLFNPLDPADATKDSDGDGFTDLAEYERGSDPEVPDAVVEPPKDEDFYPGQLVETGVDSGDLQIADLNGDGLLDLVALGGTFGAAALETSLANPDGTFQTAVSSPIGNVNSLLEFELMDLNGDDVADAVVLADPITILLGDGKGRFELAGSHPLESPVHVAAGDVNGDGALDLIAFSNREKSVHLLKNVGSGTFAKNGTFTFESSPLDATAGRFNDDSFADLAVTLQAGTIAVLLGTESGFEPPRFFPGGASAERVGAGDLNGDGFTDLVTLNKSRDDVSVLLANGDGTLAPEVRYPAGDKPSGLLLRDFNGDGHTDLLVAHRSSSFHGFFAGDGTGRLAAQERIWSSPDSRVVLRDWDGDGNDDLISPAGIGRLLIQSGDGKGSLQARDAIPLEDASVRNVQLADIDADGHLELLVLNTRTHAIDVWEHAAAGGATRRLFSLVTPAQLQAFVVFDFDNDRAPDIGALSAEPQFFGSGTNQLTLFRNEGGVFSMFSQVPLDASFSDIIAARLDSGDLLDLLLIANADDPVTPENEAQAVPLLNQGEGAFLRSNPLVAGTGIDRAVSGDLDNDGVEEIILSGFFEAPALAVFRRSADGTWTERQRFDAQVSDLAWVDIEDDGKNELVTVKRSPVNGRVLVEAHSVTTGAINPPNLLLDVESSGNRVSFADVDGNGLNDILLSAGSSFEIYLATEEGRWSSAGLYYTGGSAMAVADLNHDGQPDIIAWGLAADSISLLMHR